MPKPVITIYHQGSHSAKNIPSAKFKHKEIANHTKNFISNFWYNDKSKFRYNKILLFVNCTKQLVFVAKFAMFLCIFKFDLYLRIKMKQFKLFVLALLAVGFMAATFSSCKGSKCDCPHGTFNGKRHR